LAPFLHGDKRVGGAHGFQRSDRELGAGLTADGQVGGAEREDLNGFVEIGCQGRGGSMPVGGVFDGEIVNRVLVGDEIAAGGDEAIGFGSGESRRAGGGETSDGNDGNAEGDLSLTAAAPAGAPDLVRVEATAGLRRGFVEEAGKLRRHRSPRLRR
jgi:hypothetical protein